MKRTLENAFVNWCDGRRSPGLFLYGLAARPLSWVYRSVATNRHRKHAQKRILPLRNAKLVVISTPVVGGVGKTSLAALISTRAKQLGRRVALVTKGYRRKQFRTVRIDNSHGEPTVQSVGDEALMLWQQTGVPVSVGEVPERVLSSLDDSGEFDIVIFDDGVSRFWDDEFRVVVLTAHDCEQPVCYVPDGRWRVPPEFLRTAHAVAIVDAKSVGHERQKRHRETLKRWGYESAVGWYQSSTDCFVRRGEEDLSVDHLPEEKPLLFSGIGMPSRFERQICDLGVTPIGAERFPDHHNYSLPEIQKLEDRAQLSGAVYLLTTHKDAVKINPAWLQRLPLYYARMSLKQIAGESVIENALETSGIQHESTASQTPN